MPGAYNSETIVQRGYWMVNWFKREFGHPEQRLAAERGLQAEALFDELAYSGVKAGHIFHVYGMAGIDGCDLQIGHILARPILEHLKPSLFDTATE